MPFEDNSVDVVWAIEAVCHAKEKIQFYKEAYRVLKPGDKLLMARTCGQPDPCKRIKKNC